MGRQTARPGPRQLWIIAGLLVALAIGLGVGLSLSLTSGNSTVRGVAPLTVAFGDRATGIAGTRPASWSLSTRGGGLDVVSSDHAVVVQISAQGAAAQAPAVLTSTVAAISQEYRDVKVNARTTSRLDRLPSQVAVISATNSAGIPLHILVATAPGRHRAYLLEVFARTNAPPDDVLTAQAVTNSLRLTG